MQTNLESLCQAAKNGDPCAFEKLYETVYKKMFFYALNCLNSEEDAKDAVSDAVLDAYIGIKRLKDCSKFQSWIFSILNKKIKKKQSQYAKIRIHTAAPEKSEELMKTVCFHDEGFDSIELKEALFSLEDSDRQIVVLMGLNEFSSEETAAILGLKASTVRSRLSRCREKLRKDFLTNGGD